LFHPETKKEAMTNFVHLHNHTHYSLLDGACKIDDLMEMAVNFGMEALAITDHGNMFGVIEFYKKALKAGVKPIIGMEAYVAPGSRFDKTPTRGIGDASFHLILLAKNYKGYKNLLKLATIGYLEGFYYKPRIDKEVLREYSEGLIALSSCLKGEIPFKILRGDYQGAKKAALEYREIFGDDFYLEVLDHGTEEEKEAKKGLIELGRELSIPLVATNDTHYLKREHAEAHDILLCLQTGKDRDDPNRLRFSTDQAYFKSGEEMAQIFADLPEAIENTSEVARKCNLLLDFGKLHLPRFTIPPGEDSKTLDGYLEKLCRKGLRERYPEVTPNLEKRLQTELEVIKKMGYASYFLIVKDFIDYAKKQGIPVGPGRGSAAGSLVSYVLGITNIDPIKYDLLFERFLNPERVSLPDIDIDFCDQRRGEIIDYVRRKYGEKNVSQIITFGTMAARAVIRDVGRVLKMSYGVVDRIAKLIPASPGITLEDALKAVPELREMVNKDETHRKLIEYSRVLEGLARHASTHAAGVVIAPQELTEYLPLFRSSQGDITTQYDMKAIEDIGLLKVDFLGLRTLTVLNNTVKMLKAKGIDIDLDRIPLDDPKTYRLFSEGETIGVFQFESGGMREYLKKLKPECFEDLIAMNALYRPGPMEMIDDFIQRKRGQKEIKYLHPLLEPILKETYGVCVYQEQVMRIASEIGGFSLGEADLLRRAMGKKQPELMREQRSRFIQGAMKKKVPKEVAEEIFDMMDRFAGYGFNKSHAAGYSLIAYQSAYLKAHYPAEFMAATLSSEMGNTNRIMTLIEECQRMGIPVLPPDVNESHADFVVTDKGIRFGLGAIKNVGHAAIKSIVQAREKYGRFKTIYDFCQHLDLRLVNKKVIESLIQAGAMDSLEGHRAQLLKAVESAINFAQSFQAERSRGQTTIFDSFETGGGGYPPLPDVKPWSKTKALAKEKELLGFYLSGHPLSKYEEEIKAFSTTKLDSLNSLEDGTPVKVCGMITSVKTHFDRKNKPMVFLTLEDFTGAAEVVVFSDAYERFKKYIRTDSMVIVKGKSSIREDGNAKVLCDEIIPLAGAREKLAKNLCISIDVTKVEESALERVKELVEGNPGKCNLMINIKTREDGDHLFRSKRYKVNPSPAMVSELREILGRDNVWIEG